MIEANGLPPWQLKEDLDVLALRRQITPSAPHAWATSAGSSLKQLVVPANAGIQLLRIATAARESSLARHQANAGIQLLAFKAKLESR